MDARGERHDGGERLAGDLCHGLNREKSHQLESSGVRLNPRRKEVTGEVKEKTLACPDAPS
jgi:hypothetical protein